MAKTNFKKMPILAHFGIASGILVVLFLVCVAVGSVNIALKDTLRILLNALGIGEIKDIDLGTQTIIKSLRVPRILTAALCGAAVSLAGASMQGLLKNPLADGSTLGVTTGGTLGAVIVIGLGLSPTALGSFALPIVSMSFAFLFLVLIVTVSYAIDKKLSGITVILCGVIFSMLASGIISLIIALSGDKLDKIVFWTMGSFAGNGYSVVLILLLFGLMGTIPLLRYSEELNIISLGEEQAAFLGVNTRKVKLIVMAACAVLIGSSVAFCGAIGFVGLAVPHISRIFTGSNHRRLLPFTLLLGAIFTMLADLIARTIISPLELPVGVITQIVGAVVFIVVFILFYKRRLA